MSPKREKRFVELLRMMGEMYIKYERIPIIRESKLHNTYTKKTAIQLVPVTSHLDFPLNNKKGTKPLKDDDSFSQFSRLPHFPQPAWSHLFAMPHGLGE